jgi:hypothetical protein
MKLRHLIGVAAATFGLALAAQAAPAGPAPDAAALTWQSNGVTLAGHHNSMGSHSSPHFYNGGGGYTGPRIYNGSGSHNGQHIYKPQIYNGQHIYKPQIYSRGESYRTYGVHGHHDGRRHHRGHWRGGWYGWGPGTDESCFAECRAAGYSPAYCYANAWSFC